MKDFSTFLIYLAVMAGVTYLIRMLPLVLFRRKIESRFIRSVLHYMPYAVTLTLKEFELLRLSPISSTLCRASSRADRNSASLSHAP